MLITAKLHEANCFSPHFGSSLSLHGSLSLHNVEGSSWDLQNIKRHLDVIFWNDFLFKIDDLQPWIDLSLFLLLVHIPCKRHADTYIIFFSFFFSFRWGWGWGEILLWESPLSSPVLKFYLYIDICICKYAFRQERF